MNILEALLLGLIQGLTEFIPVSSSGHLVLADKLLGLGSGSLSFDIALHGGTLLALVVFFRRDLARLAQGLFVKTDQTGQAYAVIVATIPAAVFGWLLAGYIESDLRSSVVVAVNLIIVAILMLLAERRFHKASNDKVVKSSGLVGRSQVLTVGLSQALAIVPGVSRSGITITAGLFAGLDRAAAARFSFLLGVPIISGALLETIITGGLQEVRQEPVAFMVGAVAAFTSGMLAIRFLLGYLNSHSLKAFAYYRLGLGLLVLVLATQV